MPTETAQAIPPAAFQARNFGQGMRFAPASQAAVIEERAASGRGKRSCRRGPAKNASPRTRSSPPLPLEPPGALEQPPRTLAAEQVAEVVADDRAGRGSRDHERKRELPLPGEHAAGDQRGLPGERNPGRLTADERGEQR